MRINLKTLSILLLTAAMLLLSIGISHADTFQLGADQDDTTGWSIFNDWQGAALYLGYNANLPDVYIRWTTTIPAKAIIDSAFVTFTSTGNKSGGMTAITIYALDLAGSPVWQGSGGFNITNYANKAALDTISVETGTSVSWTPGTWVSGGEYDTPSLVTLFQNIVNDVDYNPANPIGLKFYHSASGDQRNAESFDHDPTEDAVLTVTWSVRSAQVIIIQK